AGAVHWARHAPVTRVRDFILGNRVLYGMADRSMRRYGQWRSRSSEMKSPEVKSPEVKTSAGGENRADSGRS
ncbi:hypothetical protein ACFQ07_32490, partial [Actinomadura adrarensis]